MLKENNNIMEINEQEKRDWLINIIIGIRQEVLTKLRALSESFDREKYTKVQRGTINQEIREIAELVSEKDSAVERLSILKDSKYDRKLEVGSLIDIVRRKVIELLNGIRANVLAIKYDGEYSIIDRELKEMEKIVKEKDRLVHPKVQNCYKEENRNPYLSKYFAMDDAPEIR